MCLQDHMFLLVLLYMGGGVYALERVPSDNLTAQGVDACPTGIKHLPRLTGWDWRAPHSTLWSF